MKIRDRLSLQFTIISAVLFLAVLAGIYLLTAAYRKKDFRERLFDRANTNAQLFLAEDNLSKEKFMEVQKKYPQSLPEEDVRIYDDHDTPVFIKKSGGGWPSSVIDQVRKDKSYYATDNGKQTVGIYYIDNSGNFTVLVSAKDTYGYIEMRQLFWVMFFAFFISVFILFFSGRLFSMIALSPIIKVISEVKFIRSTSLHKRLATKAEAKDEINELTVTFNNLLEHLEQSFEAQSSFVAHASHELRTPVTSIIGNVEVTLSQPRQIEEYKKTLESVLTESENLKELLNNLFELTHSNIDSTGFQDIRLDELLWQAKDEWMNHIKDSQIEVEYVLPADTTKYTIQGSESLLFLALGNIIKNAIKFSNNQKVYCKLYMNNDSPVISIIDKGIGIGKGDLEKIFKPFVRGSNTLGYSGMGIGLSLADNIFRLHNASIHVISVQNEGTEFQIKFSV